MKVLPRYLFPRGIVGGKIKVRDPNRTCQFSATYEALKRNPRGPENVTSMISERRDGGWDVSFQGFPSHPQPIQTKEISYSTGLVGTLGDKIIECAYDKLERNKSLRATPFYAFCGGAVIGPDIKKQGYDATKSTLEQFKDGNALFLLLKRTYRYCPLTGYDKAKKQLYYVDLSTPKETQSVSLGQLPIEFSNIVIAMFPPE